MFISWVHFVALLLLTTAILRWVTIKFPSNPATDAILFALG